MKKNFIVVFKLFGFFLLGLCWGYFSSKAYARQTGVDCCIQCTNYCECQDSHIYSRCETEVCPSSGSCSGNGIKCCWPY